MTKSEMKRILFGLAAQSIRAYPYSPSDLIGDRVGLAKWEDAKQEVADILENRAKPRKKKDTGHGPTSSDE